MAASKPMLVLGATGFLGGFVIPRMLREEYPIRVLTRGAADWQDTSLADLKASGVEVIVGNLTDEDTLKRAMDGVAAVVNLTGMFRERDGVSFEDLNVTTVARVIDNARNVGAQRLVHVSCLGARNDADSRYYRSKWMGEELVEQCGLYWTIFRPSFLFGEKFPILNLLRPLVKFKLFLPVIGSGTNTIQPVYVGDVASCIVQSIYDKHTVSQSYDLVGPEEYSMRELLETARKELGLGGPTMNIPSQFSGRTFDIVSKAVPSSFLTRDLAGFMSDDSYGSQDVMLRHFEVRNVALEQYFEKIMASL